MPRIYIDTNVILDFYRGATDPSAAFDELSLRPGLFIFPDQTIAEVRRNRETMVRQLIKGLESHQRLPTRSALLQGLPEYKILVESQRAVIETVKGLEARLRKMLLDPSTDLVWIALEKLLKTKDVIVIQTTNDLIGLAQRRKALGEPPTSPDKHTIGDELIWESLLADCSDNLIIVSRDGTYTAHESTLASEYNLRTGYKLLAVTQTVSEALRLAGATSPKLEEQERSIPTSEPRCENCGGELEENGYEGGEGDSAWWFQCTNCGHLQT